MMKTIAMKNMIKDSFNMVRISVEDYNGNIIGELVLNENFADMMANVAFETKESPKLYLGIKTNPIKIVNTRIGF